MKAGAVIRASPATAAASGRQVLALLDDAAAAGTLLELSSALARLLRRELSLVYVESSRSLVAAALPLTQVLTPSSQQWRPLSPQDVEQGFRVQAQRLQTMLAQVGSRDDLRCSLQVVRGSLHEAALGFSAEADLVLLAPPPTPGMAGAAPVARRRRRITALGSGAGPAPRVLQVARQLAQALAGTVEVAPWAADDALSAAPGGPPNLLAHAEVLVLPRAPLDPALLARLRCPLVLVG